MTDDAPVTIDYAETEQDCVDVHLFLCLVAKPHLLAPIDAQDSIAEVLRVRAEGAILLAKKNGHLIGSLGLIKHTWWFNTKAEFLTNRWLFVLPQFKHAGVGVRLEAEAAVIGQQAGIQVVIISHAKRRKAAMQTEPHFMREKLLAAPQE